MAKLYRVLRNLDGPGGQGIVYAGTLDTLDWLPERNIAILLGIDAVAETTAPPLEILPDWKRRAARLAKVDIITAADLLTADTKELATKIKASQTTIEDWKTEVREWLTVPPPRG
jgi:hypothetical protein